MKFHMISEQLKFSFSNQDIGRNHVREESLTDSTGFELDRWGRENLQKESGFNIRSDSPTRKSLCHEETCEILWNMLKLFETYSGNLGETYCRFRKNRERIGTLV